MEPGNSIVALFTSLIHLVIFCHLNLQGFTDKSFKVEANLAFKGFSLKHCTLRVIIF